MIRDGEKPPSRNDLINVVKKHSNFLGKTIVDEEDAAGIEMDQDFWHNLLNLYFVLGRESHGRHDDDLLFFVKRMDGNGTRSHGENPPYFVRRWAAKLDNLLGEISIEVDWMRSFYLNLIAHTSFSVTVAICSHQVLEDHRAGGAPLTPIYKVVKTVYASPSRINFHVDARKEAETAHAYPDICFAVDDFDSTFDTVVLSDRDHCYCVLLNAHDGAEYIPREKPEQDCSSGSLVPIEPVPENYDRKKVTIFSGFVSYELVREAYDGGRSWLGSLLNPSRKSARTDKVYMRGPGGHGEVEVAVSGIEDQTHHIHVPVMSNKVFGIGTIVQRAAFVASEVAKQAYAATNGASRSSEKEMLPLKCCLMSVTLPWEHIAYDLLFKTSPPVNL